jgi:hypothetical protein
MSILNFTSSERMIDAQRRPYFLWDAEMSLDDFKSALHHDDPAVRAYFLGKLMRQAKPDDVFLFASVPEIRDLWPSVQKYLGRRAAFWSWLLETWEGESRVLR